MIYIIIILSILFLFESIYTTIISSQNHKLELLNMNYSSKIIEFETQKIIDEDKLDKLAINDLYPDDKYSYGARTAEAKRDILIWKRGYRKAMEKYI